jgi:hypothetical protein
MFVLSLSACDESHIAMFTLGLRPAPPGCRACDAGRKLDIQDQPANAAGLFLGRQEPFTNLRVGKQERIQK